MNDFVVLVSRHKWEDRFTTQLAVCVRAFAIDIAREIVRTKYPPLYIRFYEAGKYLGRLAHFTGEVIRYEKKD